MITSVMDKDICCQNYKGMFAYIRNHYGEQGVRALLEGLTDNPRFCIRDKYDPSTIHMVKESHLTDPAYWVSNEFSLALFENVYKVVFTPNPLIEVGIGAVRESLSKRILFIARLSGPVTMGQQAAKINARFNKTKDVRLIDYSDDSMTFELKYRPGFKVTKNVCHWNIGIYTGGVRLTGVTNVTAKETCCVVDGADHCVFKITWDYAPWHKRLFRELIRRFIRWVARDLLEEYEATVRDRDQLIENLIRSEAKYRTLFEDSLDGMSLTTGGKIIDVNPAWLKIHGYAHKDDVIGMDVINVVHPEDRNILWTRRKTWPAVEDRFYRLRDLRNDNSFLDVEVFSSQIVVGGKVSILTTVHDITELKRFEESQQQLEERLIRAEKMEALGTLAGGVAHDLNNVLGIVVGYSEMLLDGVDKSSPLRHGLENVMNGGLRAAAIVDDLLTLARRGIPGRSILNLNKIIADCQKSPEFAYLSFHHPSVKIKTDIDPDLLNISGSSVHLGKSLYNLLANASEAMAKGGVMTIKTRNQYLDKPIQGYDKIQEGDYVVLSVSDTGEGIQTTDLKRIFEPFYTKKVMGRSGTGLGLAVVWGTVKDHHGYINVESEEGKGSTFTLYFPVTREAITADGVAIDISEYMGKGESILVVDDVKEQRDLAAGMLRTLNYNVSSVSSGEEAVAYLKEHEIDLIVLDMILDPGMDGLDTYMSVLEIHPKQKAIIVSGFSESDRVLAARGLGSGAYVRKPYIKEKLGLAVRNELNRIRDVPDYIDKLKI